MIEEDLIDIKKKLRENPNDPRALQGAARYYMRDGSYKQSRALYAQAAAFSPRSLPEILLDYERQIGNEPARIGVRLSLAGFLLDQGEIDPAIMELEEMVDEYPKKSEPYHVLGKIYIKQERIDDAIALLERSIAEGLPDINLREILAAAYLGKGKMGEAIKFYEEILALKPGDKQTLRVLGELYNRTENYLQAARCYQAMFSEDPEVMREVIQRLEDLLKKVEGSIAIREILADIYMKTLDPEAAVGKLREITRLEPNKLDEIAQRLKSVLKNYPNLPSAVLTLAEAQQRQGNYSEAVENYYQLVKVKPELMDEVIRGYREVLEFCPQQILARSYLAEALLYQNKVAEALQEFGKMVEADPSLAETVIRKCREVLKAHPQLLEAHVTLGKAYLVKGDYQRAAVEAEGVIVLDKKVTSAYLLLGEAYAKLKLGRKASETLKTALLLDPYNLRIHEKYKEAKEREMEAEIQNLKERMQEDQWRISLHLDLAKLYIQTGDRETALRELQIAVKDPARASLAYNLLGNIYRSEGRYDLAAAQYNRGLETNPGGISRVLRFNLGTTHEAQGDVKKAIKIYESILQEDIDFGNLKKRVKWLKATGLPCMRTKALAAVVTDSGKREIIAFWGREARSSHADRRSEISVSFGQEHNQAGFEYFMKGMCQAAEEEFTLAVQLDPRFDVALNNFGVSLAKAGRWEEARLRLSEAVQQNPASSIFYNNLGVVYFLLGKIDLGRTALEKSCALDAESAPACLNLGDIYYLNGKTEKAIELYRKIGPCDLLSDLAERRLLFKVPSPPPGAA